MAYASLFILHSLQCSQVIQLNIPADALAPFLAKPFPDLALTIEYKTASFQKEAMRTQVAL